MSTAWRLLHFHDVLILRSSSNRSISQITEHWYFINVDHGFIFEPALIFFLVFCLLLLFKVCRNCVESFVGKASFHSTYFIPCHLSITYGGVPRWFPCLYIWLTTCQHHCQVQCHSVLPATKKCYYLTADNRTEENQGHCYFSFLSWFLFSPCFIC